jgi:hypothetical protein
VLELLLEGLGDLEAAWRPRGDLSADWSRDCSIVDGLSALADLGERCLGCWFLGGERAAGLDMVSRPGTLVGATTTGADGALRWASIVTLGI